MSSFDSTTSTSETNGAQDASEKDMDFLLETLNQYASSLRGENEKTQKYLMQIVLYVAAFVSFVIVAFIAVFIQIGHNPIASSDTIKTIFIGYIALASILSILFIYLVTVRIGRSRAECRKLSMIVFRLIKRASQIRDRGKMSFAQKVITDVRLTDAESILLQNSYGRQVVQTITTPKKTLLESKSLNITNGLG